MCTLTCQLIREERFSTMSLWSVRTGGPYLSDKSNNKNPLPRTRGKAVGTQVCFQTPWFQWDVPRSSATGRAIATTAATSKTSHTGAATSTSSRASMLDRDPAGWTPAFGTLQSRTRDKRTVDGRIVRSSYDDGHWRNWGTRELNNLPFTTQLFAIQLVHGVVGISVVVKLLPRENEVTLFYKTGQKFDWWCWLVGHTHHKAKAILQVDLTDASVSLKELLHISLSGVWAQVADEDTTAAHSYLPKGKEGTWA